MSSCVVRLRHGRDWDTERMRIPDPLIAVGNWVLENGHRSLLKLTGGRFPRTIFGMKPVELYTMGRKSGKIYSTMLSTPVHDERRVVLVASKGGYQDHPDWYKNLVVNPDVELTIDDRTLPMRARTASPEERAKLWQAVLAASGRYGDYQRNTEREIPLVICEPRSAGQDSDTPIG
jgi:deazaflavin-dependent oxidoreductase (nitroreductase family)